MSEVNFLSVRSNQKIAYMQDGRHDSQNGPTGLFWLGGFMSDMEGSKAQVLANLAASESRPCLRFDYSGHGVSEGRFEDGSISNWLTEAIEVFQNLTSGPRVIVGSSMGGWIAFLLYRHFARTNPEIARRIVGIILIAPAADMTADLMWDKYSEDIRTQIMESGRYLEPSDYGDEPYTITRLLIEDGRKHLVLNDGLDVHCPVRILQGEEDVDVPWQHGLKVYQALRGDNITFSLIKGADHRMSSDRDLTTLQQTCHALFELAEGGQQGA